MGARELEALLQQTLDDPRIAPATRASTERAVVERFRGEFERLWGDFARR